MKNWIRQTSIILLLAGLFFSCRGGVHKNNDHDYDGKNENDDHIDQINDQRPDTTWGDSTQYPVEPDRRIDTNDRTRRKSQ